VDGKRIGEGGRFEIHVQAAVEMDCWLAIDLPVARSIRFQRQLV
jgi:hypothetical protein